MIKATLLNGFIGWPCFERVQWADHMIKNHHIIFVLLNMIIGGGLCGCIPVPFVSPPVKMSIGPGYAQVDDTQSTEASLDVPKDQAILAGSISINPLGIFEDYKDRRWDFGAGYQFNLLQAKHDETLESTGLFIEGSYYLNERPPPVDSFFRWGVIGKGGGVSMNTKGREDGFFAGVGLTFEKISWQDISPYTSLNEEQSSGSHTTSSDAQETSGEIIGLAYGELVIGGELLGNWSKVGPTSYWSVIGSLVIRLPGSIGVLFVPLDSD